jgi:hypothetical protein
VRASPIEVRIPERDTPRVRSVALVAALSMLAGLGIAWWGMERDHGTGTGTIANTNTDASTDADANPDANPDANTDANPDANTDANRDTGTGGVASAVVPPAPVPQTGGGALEPGADGPTAPLRMRRGRVAYLRCDGLRTCPRDEALEAAVWPVLDAVATCAGAPSAPGEADIRLEYAGTGAPEIVWRDTFPDDTVRLDRERVLACVEAPLARTRQTAGAERLLVSFRFALVHP